MPAQTLESTAPESRLGMQCQLLHPGPHLAPCGIQMPLSYPSSWLQLTPSLPSSLLSSDALYSGLLHSPHPPTCGHFQPGRLASAQCLWGLSDQQPHSRFSLAPICRGPPLQDIGRLDCNPTHNCPCTGPLIPSSLCYCSSHFSLTCYLFHSQGFPSCSLKPTILEVSYFCLHPSLLSPRAHRSASDLIHPCSLELGKVIPHQLMPTSSACSHIISSSALSQDRELWALWLPRQ